MSVASKTTLGGGTFEDIVKGKKTYVAQQQCLVDLKGKTNIEDIKSTLIRHCDNTLDRLEKESLSKIEKFYVGKTFIQRRRKPRGKGFITFNHMDPNTWKKNGISSRWGTHKKEDYGRDGLIVLAAITRDSVPQTNPAKTLDQEQFTLALEQTLLHHYRFKEGETRLENNSFNSGGMDKKQSKACCVYVAFKLSDIMEERGDNQQQEQHSSEWEENGLEEFQKQDECPQEDYGHASSSNLKQVDLKHQKKQVRFSGKLAS